MQQNTTYTPTEIADMIGISREGVYRGVKRGDVPHLRVGRRIIFPRAAIDRWLSDGALNRQGADDR